MPSPVTLTLQALTDSLLFVHSSQGNGEVGAAFLCSSWNRTKFPALFGQIGSREGGFGAEMRKMVAWISEGNGDKRNKLKEEIQQLVFSCHACFGLHTAPWFCSKVPHLLSAGCSCAPELGAVL